MKANYHAHTEFCDGRSGIEQVVEASFEQKLHSIGISAHAALPFPCSWTMDPLDVLNYKDKVLQVGEKYSGKIPVYLGLEMDYIPGLRHEIQALSANIKHDYLIGSIHFLGAFENGERWTIDSTDDSFEEGFQSIFHGDIKALLGRYYEYTMEMAVTMKPTIIGHFDKVKMHNQGEKYFSESGPFYKSLISEVLDVFKRTGCIVEVNTRGVYNHASRQLYPSPWILKQMSTMKIPVVVNSDAHHRDEVAKGYDVAYKILKECGYNEVLVLEGSSWEPAPIV